MLELDLKTIGRLAREREQENYEYCPIGFNVYERVKKELWRDEYLDHDFADDLY